MLQRLNVNRSSISQDFDDEPLILDYRLRLKNCDDIPDRRDWDDAQRAAAAVEEQTDVPTNVLFVCNQRDCGKDYRKLEDAQACLARHEVSEHVASLKRIARAVPDIQAWFVDHKHELGAGRLDVRTVVAQLERLHAIAVKSLANHWRDAK